MQSTEEPITSIVIDNENYISRGKYATSPDGKKSAEILKLKGKIYDTIFLKEGNDLHKIVLEDLLYSSIYSFEWVSERYIGLWARMNPSQNIYILIDSNEKKVSDVFYGLGFTWNNDKSKLYYIESSPHFAVEKTRDKIVDNKGNVYFESESGTSLLNELALSDDERTFAFFIDYENDRNLFVGKIGQYKKLHKITEISIDVGKIKFEDNSICVLKNNSAIKARFDLSEYIEK